MKTPQFLTLLQKYGVTRFNNRPKPRKAPAQVRSRRYRRLAFRALFCTVTGILLLAAAMPNIRADETWDGNTDTEWGNPDNWNAGVPTAGDAVTITEANSHNPVIDGVDAEAKTVQIGDSSTAGQLTISGGSLTTVGDVTLGHNSSGGNGTLIVNDGILNVGGGMTVGTGTTNGTGTLTITGGVVTVNGAGITLNGGSGAGTMTVSGGTVNSNITLNGTPGRQLTFDIANGEPFTYGNGYIISGVGGIIKSGDGTLILDSANTYEGSTEIQNGTLKVTDAGTLGTPSSSALIFGGGSLILDKTIILTHSVDLNAAAGTISVTEDYIATLNGEITGGEDLTKAGAGILVLTADSSGTYSGDTYLNEGSLELQHSSALGTGALEFAGAGTKLILADTLDVANDIALNEDGIIHVDGGLSDITAELSGEITGGGKLIKTGGDKLVLSHANTYTGDTVLENGELQVADSNALGSGTLEFKAGSGLPLGSTRNLILEDGVTVTNNVTLTSAGTVNVADSEEAELNGVISGSGALRIGSLENHGGKLILSGENDYTGGTTLVAGSLELQNDDALGTGVLGITGTGTTLILGAGVTDVANDIVLNEDVEIDASVAPAVLSGVLSGDGELTTTGTETLTLAGDNIYTGNTTVGAGGLTVTGTLGGGNYAGSIDTSSGGALVFDQDKNQTLRGAITGDGTLTKAGTGTLTLSAANTYTGDTVVDAGTLRLAKSGRVKSAVTVNNGAVLDLYGTVDDGKSVTLNTGAKLNAYSGSEITGNLEGGTESVVNLNITDLNGPVLKVNGDVDLTGATINAKAAAGQAYSVGKEITLIEAGTGTDFGTYAAELHADQGVALQYTYALSDTTGASGKLIARVTQAEVNPRNKSLLEGRLGTAAVLRQGQDWLTGTGYLLAEDTLQWNSRGWSSARAFFGAGGGSVRYKTGSHVDADEALLNVGLARKFNGSDGSLLLGGAFQSGWSNFDTFNGFADRPDVRGGGDSNFYGGNFFGKYRLRKSGVSSIDSCNPCDPVSGESPVLSGSFYAEASFLFGKADTSFYSADLSGASYDTNSPYLGYHVGLGREWQITGRTLFDLSARYIYLHQGGNDVTILGDTFRFSSTTSHRLRLGGRLSSGSGVFSTYVGAAFEYELDGEAEGSVYGYAMDAPTLRGGTAVGELGLNLQSGHWRTNLGAQGYLGKREGVSGHLGIAYVF